MNEPVPGVDVAELSELLKKGAELIDVREPNEYAEVRVPGARLVPLGIVPDSLDSFPEGKFYVICKSGGRSHRAAEWLRSNDLDAVNVVGGTSAWVAAGLTTESGGA